MFMIYVFDIVVVDLLLSFAIIILVGVSFSVWWGVVVVGSVSVVVRAVVWLAVCGSGWD